MNDQKLISHLKKIRQDPPDDAWLQKDRAQLLLHMRKSSPKESMEWLPALERLLTRPLFSGALAGVILAAVSMGFVGAAKDALPTSPLYPVKLSLEAVGKTLTFSQKQEALHELRIAGNRVHELEGLWKSREPATDGKKEKSTALITKTVTRYTKALGTSTKTLEKLRADGNSESVGLLAKKLEEAALAYTLLFTQWDGTTSSSIILKDASILSQEAQETAGKILREAATAESTDATVTPPLTGGQDSGSQEIVASISPALVSPEPSPSSTTTPVPVVTSSRTMPNVVGE